MVWCGMATHVPAGRRRCPPTTGVMAHADAPLADAHRRVHAQGLLHTSIVSTQIAD